MCGTSFFCLEKESYADAAAFCALASVFMRTATFFLYILFISRQDTAAVAPSAMINVYQTTEVSALELSTNWENAHATGRTNSNCLKTEIINRGHYDFDTADGNAGTGIWS